MSAAGRCSVAVALCVLSLLAATCSADEARVGDAPFIVVPSQIMTIATKLVTATLERCATEYENQLEGIVSCFEHPKGTAGVLPKLRFLCRGATFADMAQRIVVSVENQKSIDEAMTDLGTYCNKKEECVQQQCVNVRRIVKSTWEYLKVKELEPRQRATEGAQPFEVSKWEKETMPAVLDAAHSDAEKKGPPPMSIASVTGEESLGAVADDPAKSTAVSKAFNRFRRGTIELCWPQGAPRDTNQFSNDIKQKLLLCYAQSRAVLMGWCTEQRKSFSGCYLDMTLLQLSEQQRVSAQGLSSSSSSSRLSALRRRMGDAPVTSSPPPTTTAAAGAPAAAPVNNAINARKQNVDDLKAAIQQLCANCECYTNVCRQASTELDNLVESATKLQVKA